MAEEYKIVLNGFRVALIEQALKDAILHQNRLLHSARTSIDIAHAKMRKKEYEITLNEWNRIS